MRVLILGGDGMLGHQLLTYLQPRHEVRVTLRQDAAAYNHYPLFTRENSCAGIDVRALDRLVEVSAEFRPDVVVNAVGIVKQRKDAKESVPSLEINALLPHRLSILCKAVGARLIHMSTDCVFSGSKGRYQETDLSDAEDLYGKTKFLGEVHGDNCVTLRTSIIGRELSRKSSLLEWFLAQRGTIRGFTRAIYTGFTTLEMSRIIEMVIQRPKASGLYQVASDPITKYDLLLLFREKLMHDVVIEPDASFSCDRSLDGSRFRAEFNYVPPTWPAMIDELRSCP